MKPKQQRETRNACLLALSDNCYSKRNIKQKMRRRMMMAKNEIAIRLYENKKFGTTYGKGLYHSAVFNASADLLGQKTKYLMDFHSFDRWQHTARTDEQMEILELVEEKTNADTLVSWVVRYDMVSKTKTPVLGYATVDLNTHDLEVVIVDPDVGVQSRWQLSAKPCRERSWVNSPSFLATNAESLARY